MNKEQFFKNILVPTGQLVEILANVYRSKHRYRVRYSKPVANLSFSILDPLGLASTYVLSPSTVNIAVVAMAVEQMQKAILDTLAAVPVKALSNCVNGGTANFTSTESEKVGQAIVRFERLLPKLTEAIHGAIGYQPHNRQKWIDLYHKEGNPMSGYAPGSRSTRPNRWRTFVRNGDWTQAINLLGRVIALKEATFSANGIRLNAAYANQEGALAAAMLWTACFGEAASSDSIPDRLPSGVSVFTTSDSRLCVEATFDPRKHLAPSVLAAVKLDATMKPLLQSQRFQAFASIANLQAVVEEAVTWLATQDKSKATIMTAAEDVMKKRKIADIQKKLKSHFSTEDMSLLAEVLKSV